MAERSAFEIFSTTADVGLRLRAGDIPGLLESAASGLMQLVFGSWSGPNPETQILPFQFSGDSWENVLVNWLAEMLYLVYEKRRAVGAVRILEIGHFSCRAELLTIPWPKNPEIEIKSATYHNLRIRQRNRRLFTEIILDI